MPNLRRPTQQAKIVGQGAATAVPGPCNLRRRCRLVFLVSGNLQWLGVLWHMKGLRRRQLVVLTFRGLGVGTSTLMLRKRERQQ